VDELEGRLAGLETGTVAVLGVPYDEGSSFLRGPASAPPRIREALHSPSANLSTESGLDLASEPGWKDLGDLTLPPETAALTEIESSVGRVLDRGARLIALGGDHTITWPILRPHARGRGALDVLQLDAHPDLYDELEGNRHLHCSPFARIMEEGLARRLVQLGIRTANPHQREQAERFGVEMVEMRDWRPGTLPEFDGPVYLSVDLDVLDPAYAPGVSHHEPGGFSTREVLGIIQDLGSPIVGADIVEFNPDRDPGGTSAMTCAKILKEILAKMVA
jgi:agmatinase